MSTNLAETMPLGRPVYEPRPDEQPRHIEIVSTRSQRRARPRPIYAIVIVGGLFVLFIAQLLMSIVVSNGAYQISSLQNEQRTLTQTANALGEQEDLLSSPGSLAVMAARQGMVETDQTPNFLRLSDGKIIGDEKAATETSKLGPTVVPNKLLSDAKKAKQLEKDREKSGTPATTDTDAPVSGSELPAVTQ